MQVRVQVQVHVQVQVQVQVHVQVQVLYSVPVADVEVPPVCPRCTPLPAGACSGNGALLLSLACFCGLSGDRQCPGYQVPSS